MSKLSGLGGRLYRGETSVNFIGDGELVRGVRRQGPLISTESIVLRARSGTIRRVSADHQASKWLDE